MDNFSYSRPATLKEATASQLGKEHGKIALIAGGTDLLGEMKDNLAAPERLVYIRHLEGAAGSSRQAAGGLRIGAATLLADVVENPMVQEQTPLLAMAAGKSRARRRSATWARSAATCVSGRGAGTTGTTIPASSTAATPASRRRARTTTTPSCEGGPSFIVHPSDTAPALVALGATARIVERLTANGWSRWTSSS